MDIAASLIKLIFGSKADKDRKQIEPYLEKIKAVYPAIEALSNDELRARSEALKKQIADFIAADEARIVELKAKLELAETSLEEKEKVSKEIDETTKRIDEKIEEKLDEILPEAFAIMKDTARRFAQNETVVVTANDFDRDLAAVKDFVLQRVFFLHAPTQRRIKIITAAGNAHNALALTVSAAFFQLHLSRNAGIAYCVVEAEAAVCIDIHRVKLRRRLAVRGKRFAGPTACQSLRQVCRTAPAKREREQKYENADT